MSQVLCPDEMVVPYKSPVSLLAVGKLQRLGNWLELLQFRLAQVVHETALETPLRNHGHDHDQQQVSAKQGQ